jgi:hypothetical protein
MTCPKCGKNHRIAIDMGHDLHESLMEHRARSPFVKFAPFVKSVLAEYVSGMGSLEVRQKRVRIKREDIIGASVDDIITFRKKYGFAGKSREDLVQEADKDPRIHLV